MKRMKSYDVPHKGLRNALSQLSLLAGKTDYSKQREVEELYHLGTDIFKILSIHAADEDQITLLELEERCPGCTDHDKEDHKMIHEKQDELEAMLTNLYRTSKGDERLNELGQEFYLRLTEFHGTYLSHTAEEERVTQALLWNYFTDEELAQHRNKIMAKNPPETLLIWFRFVIPAQSHPERLGLLKGFKKMAPPDFYKAGMKVIQKFISEAEFELLSKDLENEPA